MFFIAIFFLLGICIVQQLTQLPDLRLILLITSIIICLTVRWSRFKYLLILLIGMSYATWYASSILAFQLPTTLEGKPLMITGVIASIPEQTAFGKRFEFKLHSINDHAMKINADTLVRLVAPQFYQLHVGDEWRWQVKLKRIHGLQNAGGFDFEAWALQKRIRATGSVISNSNNQLISQHYFLYIVSHLREIIQQRLTTMPMVSPWMSALLIGERSNISSDDWEVLRKTGTNHLMVIAGLHIGLLAGFVHALTMRMLRIFPRILLYFPAMHISLFVSFIFCLLYALLSGLALPSQRSLMMLLPILIVALLQRSLSPWHVWSFALIVVLLNNPLSVLNESFWLSFVTIALIIYGMSARLAPNGWWWEWGRVQWVIAFGLIPLSLTLFQECSLISFIVNTIAIPWLGFVILPLCLISLMIILISPFLATYFVAFTSMQLNALWFVLQLFAKIPMASWSLAIPSLLIFILLTIGVLTLLLPAGFPGKYLGIIWCLPLFASTPEKPKSADFWLSIIDVGQGLAVVVQTERHTLLYDTGPAMLNGINAGESNVIPYLRSRAIKKLNTVIISHGDNDHSGGLAKILSVIPAKRIYASDLNRIHLQPKFACHSGTSWQWDGVTFTFLYPSQQAQSLGNDSSCVLRIANQTHQVLLPGDIEKFAEGELLSTQSELKSTVLIVPHHGSKTSSTKEFIKSVLPQFVIYSTGYRNRYHLPHPSIVARYAEMNSRGLNTVTSGSIEMKLREQKPVEIGEYRLTHRHYWFDS